MGREGSYMLSELGACDLDEVGCRRQFFPMCRPRDLENVTGLKAIQRRVELMETHTPALNGPAAIAIPRLEHDQKCIGELNDAEHEAEGKDDFACGRSLRSGERRAYVPS